MADHFNEAVKAFNDGRDSILFLTRTIREGGGRIDASTLATTLLTICADQHRAPSGLLEVVRPLIDGNKES